MRRFKCDWSKVISYVIAQSGLTQDAGETALFTRQLEYVYKETYDILYPEYRARSFIPVDYRVPTGAESWNYKQFDSIGEAAIISNYADDLPGVDVVGKEFVGGIKGIGDSYSYSVQDLRNAQMSGFPIDTMRAGVARRAIESKLDSLAALGSSAHGFSGFVNHGSVPTVALAAAGAWSTKTPTQILADMNKTVNSVHSTTKGVHKANTMLLPLDAFDLIASTRVDATSDKTILRHFLETNPYIRNIDQWNLLDTAGAGSTTRMVVYDRNPQVVQMVIPQEFEQFPPQVKGLSYSIYCHMRYAGIKLTYPKAMAYTDGI